MNDTTQFLYHQIKALRDQLREEQDKNIQLTGYIFELLDPDTPEEYKKVIRHEVFKPDVNYNYEN
jgi:hypothetical protein